MASACIDRIQNQILKTETNWERGKLCQPFAKNMLVFGFVILIYFISFHFGIVSLALMAWRWHKHSQLCAVRVMLLTENYGHYTILKHKIDPKAECACEWYTFSAPHSNDTPFTIYQIEKRSIFGAIKRNNIENGVKLSFHRCLRLTHRHTQWFKQIAAFEEKKTETNRRRKNQH